MIRKLLVVRAVAQRSSQSTRRSRTGADGSG